MTLPHPATQDAVWPHLSQPQWSLHLGATPGKTVRGAAFLQEGTLPLRSGKTLRGGRGRGAALLQGTLPLQAQFSPPVFK